jgi:hypothetical protein
MNCAKMRPMAKKSHFRPLATIFGAITEPMMFLTIDALSHVLEEVRAPDLDFTECRYAPSFY